MNRIRSGVGGGVGALLLVLGVTPSLAGQAREPMGQAPRSIVEIRSYNLKPGTRETFHRLVIETLPMLQRWKVDVVGYGPSPHDETSYFLIRAFTSLDDRERREDAFYGSTEWRDGPRDRVLALIESYTTVVLELDSATVRGLRAAGNR